MSSLNNFIENTTKKNQPQLPQDFEYISEFLSQDVASNLYDELIKELDWEEREI